MLAQELREMSIEQLGDVLNSTRSEMFKLRVKAAADRVESPSEVRRLRRLVARVKTVLGEKKAP